MALWFREVTKGSKDDRQGTLFDHLTSTSMQTPSTQPINFEQILKDAKAEWLQNAPWTYGEDSINVWEEEIEPRLRMAKITELDLEDLRLYCPKMLGHLPDVFCHQYVEDVCREVGEILKHVK